MSGRTDDELPSISVLIRTKNEERFIARTLEAVFAQDIRAPIEVIIVDSGSTDNTLSLASQFSCRIFRIDPERFTFGYALNYGARQARGRYVINLSAHCVPAHSSWMRNLLHPLEERPTVAATFGRQLPMKGVNPFEERALDSQFPNERAKKRKTPFSNANSAVRREVWETHPFDELAPGSEDYIWPLQLPAELEIEYVPEAAVYHSHPLSIRYWTKRFYQHGLTEEYVRNVYGSDMSGKGERAGSALRKAVTAARNHAKEFFRGLKFLWARGYSTRIPLYAVYFVMERYYYRKGLRDGRPRYRLTKESE